ncbi:MAG: GH1 family beta-glucosidase [Candidatus Limnocylindria bacterium]
MTSHTDEAKPIRAPALEAGELARRFPPGFLWGAATSAYQVEGAVNEGGRGPSIWDTFSHTAGMTAGGGTGDVATDHYHRLAEDLDLMASLGLSAYRFSVAWPRIQPTGTGAANDAGLDFYDRLVDGLVERGIEPWLTLYHWDLPQALEDRGGWPWRGVVDAFGEYAGTVAARLGDRVTRWVTLNEPQIVATHGYGQGVHAPGRRNWRDALWAAHHLHLAHRSASAAIRSEAPRASVGIAFNLAPVTAASDHPADQAAAARRDSALNRWYLDPAFGLGYPAELVSHYGSFLEGLDLAELDGPAPALDFVGVNYYAREIVRAGMPADHDPTGTVSAESQLAVTGLGWEIYPDGLREVLERIARDYHPPAVVVTENGAGYQDVVAPDGSVNDSERRAYLASHIAAAADAIEGGVPLIGYFAWSLLDNFEWQRGYAARFGIVRVDYATQRRTVKASGRWYADLVAAAR